MTETSSGALSNLTLAAMQSIEQATLTLSGDEDFMPFLTIRNPQNEFIYMGIVGLGDAAADVMTAACVVHRAVEVTFASAAWMVAGPNDGSSFGDLSEHPDRQEIVQLCVMTADGNAVMHSANIIRENGKVGIGLWEETAGSQKMGGRYPDAIRSGIELAAQLPPELIDYVDNKLSKDPAKVRALIQTTVGMLAELRKSLGK